MDAADKLETGGDGCVLHPRAPSIAFLSAPVRRGTKIIRKRRRDGESSEEEVDLEKISELREDQKLRTRPRGLDIDALNKPADVISSLSSAKAAADAPADANKSILGSGFTGQVGSDVRAEDALITQYVARRMAEISGRVEEKDTAGSSAEAAAAAATASLFELPEHLRAVAPRGPKLDADVGEGGVVLAGTGIAEVALPIEFKLKNIDDTETAKRAYLMRQAARHRGDFAAMATLPSSALDDLDIQASGRHISGSMTSNFNQHRRDFAAALVGNPIHPAGGPNGPGGIAAPIKVGEAEPTAAAAAEAAEKRAARAAQSSDDKVFQSFRKAEIHRNR